MLFKTYEDLKYSLLFFSYKLGPEPAFGRLGLGESLGGYSSHGYTSQSHASLRAYGAQLGGDILNGVTTGALADAKP